LRANRAGRLITFINQAESGAFARQPQLVQATPALPASREQTYPESF
jgi:hypothetical protein